MVITKDAFSYEKALEASAKVAAKIWYDAIEECEEMYNGEDLEDCRQDPDIDVDNIEIILSSEDFINKESYQIPFNEALQEAIDQGLI